MSSFATTLIFLLAIGTLILDGVLLFALVALCKASWRVALIAAAQSQGLLLVFIFSTLAVAGTLFIQFAGGFTPCDLCWWQRIFMYPIPLVSFIALLKGKNFSAVADYILVFALIGAFFALYQHLLQILPAGALIPCDSTNDCAIRTIFYFNFITIPWMSLTLFVAFFLAAFLGRSEHTH